MTLLELRDELNRIMDADHSAGARLVIVQKDSEGNGYSPLSAVDAENCAYLADSTWSGEVGLERLTPSMEDAGYEEEDVCDGAPAAVLCPVN